MQFNIDNLTDGQSILIPINSIVHKQIDVLFLYFMLNSIH